MARWRVSVRGCTRGDLRATDAKGDGGGGQADSARERNRVDPQRLLTSPTHPASVLPRPPSMVSGGLPSGRQLRPERRRGSGAVVAGDPPDVDRLVYRLDAAAEIEVAVFDVAGRLTDCQSGGAAIGLAGTPSISPQAAPNPGAPGRRSHPSLRDLGTRRPGGTAQPPARPVRSKAAAAAHRGRP